jgi:putative two-component system response regulator
MSESASANGTDAAPMQGHGTARGPLTVDETSLPSGRMLAGMQHPAALFEFATDAVVCVSTKGTIESWNDGAERLFGYAREEAIGREATMLCAPERVAEAKQLLARASAGESIEDVEIERVAKDGHLVRARLTAFPLLNASGDVEGAIGLLHDATSRRKIEEDLRASEERYRSVIEALNDGVLIQIADGRAVAFNRSAQRILGLSAEQLEVASTENPAVFLIHEDGSTFRAHELPTMVTLRNGEPQTGVVMGVKRPDGQLRWISVNSAPLYRAGQAKPYAAIGSFTDVTGYRQTLDALRAARLEDLKRLALVSEYRDDETNRHTERVAHTAELLALELGLRRAFAWEIRRAAPLHDVGKVGIPDSILLKPGRLTAEEFEVMKTHTTIGGRILDESDFRILQLGREIALTHHERWDGKGYPAGLARDEIPVSGRIVAVADAFDAMTHHRPYKDRVEVAIAVEELERCAGAQFDPEVVTAFLALDHATLVDNAETGSAADDAVARG